MTQPASPAPAPATPPIPVSSTKVRGELLAKITKDLLGPAGGPEEELSWRDRRVSDRYLVGMLAPQKNPNQDVALFKEGNGDEAVPADSINSPEVSDDLAAETKSEATEGAQEKDSHLSADFSASSMGLSFCIDPSATEALVSATWGRYKRIVSETQKDAKGHPQHAWKRLPQVCPEFKLPLVDGVIAARKLIPADNYLMLRGRIRKTPSAWVVTLFLVNTEPAPERLKDESFVFQPVLRISGTGGTPIFIHKIDHKLKLENLERLYRQEYETLEMLYRNRVEFASGHGVSVAVTVAPDNPQRATAIETTFIPEYEVGKQMPPTTTDNPKLASINLDMKSLAEMPQAALAAELTKLADYYQEWITAQEAKISDAASGLTEHSTAAKRSMENCKKAMTRIKAGIDLIAADTKAFDSFAFANRAMYLQRVHSELSKQVRKGLVPLGSAMSVVDSPDKRTWRPFQLAFVLMNLPAITVLDNPERSAPTDAIADLLWFPTGGGKTEAYLGLTAYTIAIRRLQGPIGGYDGENGVAVLMRYTLRLLTLQQFQRAAALMCACEYIRKTDESKWGKTTIRLGLWVGSKSTPNTLKQAADAVASAVTGSRPTFSGTPKQLTTCPWCGADIKDSNIKVRNRITDDGRCVINCGDPLGRCEFTETKSKGDGLPVMVVDEDIYRRPPALLIATVDKFAQITWNGKTQMLFGKVNGVCPRHGFLSPEVELEDSGKHTAAQGKPATEKQPHPHLRPPDLIIQDELHLISGPLGSMVGLYESAIDELCTWTVAGKRVRPKVIASTATIRRAEDQVKKLFLRAVEVFPPSGLEVEDNFFSIQKKPSEDIPGRKYIGVCAFGRRYPEAMIRVYLAALAGGQVIYNDYDTVADPWLTLVGYFNSIRELAGTRRLVDDDVRNRLREMDKRGLAARKINYDVAELTSRISGSKIPGTLASLEIQFSKAMEAKREAERKAGGRASTPTPYDVLLATNMISVGVDVDRLGLMVVGGQPKTTAEYIQATSRVGRASNGPGLVITLFNWARPRDLSHYEKFENYHSTFYKHVEPLSVTPFAARALDRGLSGALVGLIRASDFRLNDNGGAAKLEDTDPLMKGAKEYLANRAESVMDDRTVGKNVADMVERRREEWLRRKRNAQTYKLTYDTKTKDSVGLLTLPGPDNWDIFTCMNSLRDVEGMTCLMLSEKAPAPAGSSPAQAPETAAPSPVTETPTGSPEKEAN